MKINCYSVTFWFNIFDNHNFLLEVLQNELKDEYDKYNFFKYTNNLVAPIISAINNEKMTNLSFSQINLQYNMDKVSLKNIDDFKTKVQKLFDILSQNEIQVLHTAIYVNGEIIDDNALNNIIKYTINPSLNSDSLVDINLKLGKCYEELFYKNITLLNKKQIKLPKITDKQGRNVPIPLISWNGAYIENELIDFSYEINDKYLFDFTKDYHTTEFYLNKMLYLLSENLEDDINNLINKGEF